MCKLSCPIVLASQKNNANAIPRSGRHFHPQFFAKVPSTEMTGEILLAIKEQKA